MDIRQAVKLAAEMVELKIREGAEGLRADPRDLNQNAAGALARMAQQAVPDDAQAAVLGRQGGTATFAAISADGRALYLLQPLPFDATNQQHASAECRVVPVDHAQASVSRRSRWWESMGTEGRVTRWRIEISGEVLEFTTERDFDEEIPADEAFALALCAAAGLPPGPEAIGSLAQAA